MKSETINQGAIAVTYRFIKLFLLLIPICILGLPLILFGHNAKNSGWRVQDQSESLVAARDLHIGGEVSGHL